MIQIILSDRAFENDVHPLVKAFYPREEIKVYENGIKQQVRDDFNRQTEQTKEDGNRVIQLFMIFDEQRVTISLETNPGEIITGTIDTGVTIREKSKYKNAMKRKLYEMLSGVTKKELPWGILTGIRPTKLVYEMLADKIDWDEIHRSMQKEYICSKEKVGMSIRIAARELELLTAMDYRNGYSLYIGIPFCPSTCLYCSFPSYSIERFSSRVEEYLNALEKEILYGASCFPNKKLTTVYLGGGTPTTLTADQLSRLLGLVRKQYDFSYVKEFCVEAGRPDSITKEKLKVMKEWGVDRISINPQSMQQRTLDLIGRRHTVEQVEEAFNLARETGHTNINMDLIIGLPGETPEDVADTLRKVKKLNPDSLTVHTLAIKRAARLNTERENYQGLRAEDVPGMLDTAIRFAEENHYLPYYLYRQKNMADNLENIGYAKYGKEGLYNIMIMEEKQTILAFGAGAMSKFVFHDQNRIERVDNVKSITDYISRIDEMIRRKKDFLSEAGSL